MANDDVTYRFLGTGTIHSIPARDLTDADIARLPLLSQRDVRSGKLYERVDGRGQEEGTPNLSEMYRDDLDEYAADHGVDDPGSYPNKESLVEAIEGGN
jgi:hypothetical protein